MYQLVIFDWDGTLMDSTQKIANCLRASARDFDLVEPSVAAAKNVIGLGLDECMQILFPSANLELRQRLVERYKYHFVTLDSTSQGLFAGVEQGLQRLDDAGVLLAIATGKSRVGLDRAFKDGNIESLFTVTRCADETRTKPHPQMLHEILDFTAIDANKAIMVGDTSYDMQMAGNANLAGLGVAYGAHTAQTLSDNQAVSVQTSVDAMFDWLLDGRVEKAFS